MKKLNQLHLSFHIFFHAREFGSLFGTPPIFRFSSVKDTRNMELTHVNYFLSLKFLSLQILRIFLCCYSIFILSQNAVSLHFLTKNMPILYKQVTESRNNRALEARFFFCPTSRKSYKKQKESNYVHLTYFD